MKKIIVALIRVPKWYRSWSSPLVYYKSKAVKYVYRVR